MEKKFFHNYKTSTSKKKIDSNFRSSIFSLEKNNPKHQNVNINTLLNRVKINEKNEKKEKLALFGLGSCIIGLTSVFIFFT